MQITEQKNVIKTTSTTQPTYYVATNSTARPTISQRYQLPADGTG